ncbi:MAG: hypothetical protein Pg6A_09160 [Termitinemataceae bacterium]|nr:MAG: hypothetical protein Pg6A_09160 [Termitinemataceae bacterium]
MKWFCIPAALVLSACSFVGSVVETTGISGLVLFDSQIAALGYNIKAVHIFTREGQPIVSVEPVVVYKPLPPYVDYITWEAEVPAPLGTPITFWVEFFDSATRTVYFGQSQEDIITNGNSYCWNIVSLYIPIRNEADLKSIGYDPRFLPNKNYILLNDIFLTNKLTPLCSNRIPFSGIFDGNGHTIHNVDFNVENIQFVGLFGVIKDAFIKNFTIEFSGTLLELGGMRTQYAGIVAGIAERSRIEKISVKRAETENPTPLNIIKSDTTDFFWGGLVGLIACDYVGAFTYESVYVTISACSLQLPIYITLNYSYNGPGDLFVHIGGLVGSNGPYYNANNNHWGVGYWELITHIEKSYALFDIGVHYNYNHVVDANYLKLYLGGILGSVDSMDMSGINLTIEEVFFAGNINVNVIENINQSIGLVTGGILGGSRNNQFINIDRAIVLTKRIDFIRDQPGSVASMIAGSVNPTKTSCNYVYSASGFIVNPEALWQSSTSSINGQTIDRDQVNEIFFRNSVSTGGLAWDFQRTWRWSSIRGCPVFRWE